MDLLEVGAVDPKVHWYYQHKLKAVASSLLPRLEIRGTLVDVGAGSGFFAEEILTMASFHNAICIDVSYSEEDVRIDGPIRYVREGKGKPADLYLFMDVLEHVDDDIALLAEYVDTAPPGAWFIVTVPAFRALWSSHDVFLEHRRRYRIAEIENVCHDAGLEIWSSRYLFAPLFPLIWLKRQLRRGATPASDLTQPPVILNQALSLICKSELLFSRNRLFGSTAFVMARKSQDSTQTPAATNSKTNDL